MGDAYTCLYDSDTFLNVQNTVILSSVNSLVLWDYIESNVFFWNIDEQERPNEIIIFF